MIISVNSEIRTVWLIGNLIQTGTWDKWCRAMTEMWGLIMTHLQWHTAHVSQSYRLHTQVCWVSRSDWSNWGSWVELIWTNGWIFLKFIWIWLLNRKAFAVLSGDWVFKSHQCHSHPCLRVFANMIGLGLCVEGMLYPSSLSIGVTLAYSRQVQAHVCIHRSDSKFPFDIAWAAVWKDRVAGLRVSEKAHVIGHPPWFWAVVR